VGHGECDNLLVTWVAREWVSVATGLDQVGAWMGLQAKTVPAATLVLMDECMAGQRRQRNGVIFRTRVAAAMMMTGQS
jgi:hypothetical protein